LNERFAFNDGIAAWPASLGGISDWNLLVPQTSEIAARLAGFGQAEALQAFEVLRIEAGLPEMGKEILADSIPLEVGLRPAISFTKGCYIGQEIMARMDSRGRLAKALCGIRLAGFAAPGASIRQRGQRAGTLTSVARSTERGWIGLAIARPQAKSDLDGTVELDGVGQRLEGQLVDLPFKSA
jgi:folate-binding protein YgfZ